LSVTVPSCGAPRGQSKQNGSAADGASVLREKNGPLAFSVGANNALMH
jgi:hypothetical protein